ncbi:MAG: radical SAM protein [Candidatus Aminicenantes bacterium]|nr:radical SAM protein [Candidatus Aminicenantes bacterium]
MERFCSYPFTKAHFSVSGKVYVCCAPWLGIPIGNIFSQPFDEIWNSAEAVKIRGSILDGSFRYCRADRCPRMITGLVEKEVHNREYRDIIKEKTTVLDWGPRLISLNYDNSCNLYCASCRDRVMVINKKKQEELIRFQDSFIHSDSFKNARRITVSGSGETFASAVYMDLFNKIEKPMNPDLKITFRTNGLLLTPGNWDRVKNIHYAVDLISISIDAASEKTYRLLRRGGDFKKLLANLEFLKELKKKKPIRVKLNFVVQKANYREMPVFIRLAKKYDCDVVAFAKILNLGTFNSRQYIRAAVHEPANRAHKKFKKLLKQPIFKDPIVKLRNLSNLVD